MDKINRTYICKDNTYIIINYTTDEKINKDKLIVLDEIFNKEYNNFSLIEVTRIIRTILNTTGKTFRITISKLEDISRLVYFSNSKLIKYMNMVEYNGKLLLVRYSTKGGLMITASDENYILGELIKEEITNINILSSINTNNKVLRRKK